MHNLLFSFIHVLPFNLLYLELVFRIILTFLSVSFQVEHVAKLIKLPQVRRSAAAAAITI